jgi:hypothetical protein
MNLLQGQNQNTIPNKQYAVNDNNINSKYLINEEEITNEMSKAAEFLSDHIGTPE